MSSGISDEISRIAFPALAREHIRLYKSALEFISTPRVGSSNINTISVNSPERYTYEFNIDYSVYKDVHCDLEYESMRW